MVLAALAPLKAKALAKVLSSAPGVLEFMAQEASPEVRPNSQLWSLQRDAGASATGGMPLSGLKCDKRGPVSV